MIYYMISMIIVKLIDIHWKVILMIDLLNQMVVHHISMIIMIILRDIKKDHFINLILIYSNIYFLLNMLELLFLLLIQTTLTIDVIYY